MLPNVARQLPNHMNTVAYCARMMYWLPQHLPNRVSTEACCTELHTACLIWWILAPVTLPVSYSVGARDGFIPHCHIQLNVRNDESGGCQAVKDALRLLLV